MVKMERKITIAFLLLVIILTNSMCGGGDISPEQARLDLAKMNIQYTKSSFIDRVKEGDNHVVNLFLIAGMDPNTNAEDGGMALIWAIVNRHTKTAKLLLRKGADPNAMAAKSQFTGVLVTSMKAVPWAVAHAEQIKKVANYGLSALSVAVIVLPNDYRGLVVLLLEKGANPNKGYEGWVPLRFTVGESDVEIVKLLLEKGANPQIKDTEGRTPLDDAQGKVREILEKKR